MVKLVHSEPNPLKDLAKKVRTIGSKNGGFGHIHLIDPNIFPGARRNTEGQMYIGVERKKILQLLTSPDEYIVKLWNLSQHPYREIIKITISIQGRYIIQETSNNDIPPDAEINQINKALSIWMHSLRK